jgi:hypothetical protein
MDITSARNGPMRGMSARFGGHPRERLLTWGNPSLRDENTTHESASGAA